MAWAAMLYGAQAGVRALSDCGMRIPKCGCAGVAPCQSPAARLRELKVSRRIFEMPVICAWVQYIADADIRALRCRSGMSAETRFAGTQGAVAVMDKARENDISLLLIASERPPRRAVSGLPCKKFKKTEKRVQKGIDKGVGVWYYI